MKHLDLLGKVERFVLKAQQVPGSMTGFFFDDYVENEEPKSVIFKFPKYEANIARARVYGRPDAAYGLAIQESENSFLLVGCGFQVTFKSRDDAYQAGILQVVEQECVDGHLQTLRLLNGDETQSGKCAMMPSESPDYGGFPVAITVPANTKIARVTLYCIDN